MLAVTNADVHAMTQTPAELRSRRWFVANDLRGFAHRQRMQQMGLRREDVVGRPIVGIINTWSDLSPCHAHLRDRAEAVKRGVLLAGATRPARWPCCARLRRAARQSSRSGTTAPSLAPSASPRSASTTNRSAGRWPNT